MNMDVSNDELKELLERFMNRLDKMEKEREQTRSPEHKAELTRLKKLKLQVKSQLDKLL